MGQAESIETLEGREELFGPVGGDDGGASGSTEAKAKGGQAVADGSGEEKEAEGSDGGGEQGAVGEQEREEGFAEIVGVGDEGIWADILAIGEEEGFAEIVGVGDDDDDEMKQKKKKKRAPAARRCVARCEMRAGRGGKPPRARIECRKAAEWSELGEAADRRLCSNDPVPPKGRRCRRLRGARPVRGNGSKSLYARLCELMWARAREVDSKMSYSEMLVHIKRRRYYGRVVSGELTVAQAVDDATEALRHFPFMDVPAEGVASPLTVAMSSPGRRATASKPVRASGGPPATFVDQAPAPPSPDAPGSPHAGPPASPGSPAAALTRAGRAPRVPVATAPPAANVGTVPAPPSPDAPGSPLAVPPASPGSPEAPLALAFLRDEREPAVAAPPATFVDPAMPAPAAPASPDAPGGSPRASPPASPDAPLNLAFLRDEREPALAAPAATFVEPSPAPDAGDDAGSEPDQLPAHPCISVLSPGACDDAPGCTWHRYPPNRFRRGHGRRARGGICLSAATKTKGTTDAALRNAKLIASFNIAVSNALSQRQRSTVMLNERRQREAVKGFREFEDVLLDHNRATAGKLRAKGDRKRGLRRLFQQSLAEEGAAAIDYDEGAAELATTDDEGAAELATTDDEGGIVHSAGETAAEEEEDASGNGSSISSSSSSDDEAGLVQLVSEGGIVYSGGEGKETDGEGEEEEEQEQGRAPPADLVAFYRDEAAVENRMRIDPLSRGPPPQAEADALRVAEEREATVVRTGPLLPRRRPPPPAQAAHRAGDRGIAVEIGEYRRLGAAGITPPLLWHNDRTGYVAVAPLARTLFDVVEAQGGTLTAPQLERIAEIINSGFVQLQDTHVRYALYVFAEGTDGQIYLIHPTNTGAARRSRRAGTDYNERTLAVFEGLAEALPPARNSTEARAARRARRESRRL